MVLILNKSMSLVEFSQSFCTGTRVFSFNLSMCGLLKDVLREKQIISWLGIPGVVTLRNFTLIICLMTLSYSH